MEHLKTLRVKRGSLEARLANFQIYVEKCMTQIDSIDDRVLKNRLSDIESLLAEFSELQVGIECSVKEEDLQGEYDKRKAFENDFYSIISKAQGLAKENSTDNVGSASVSNPGNSRFPSSSEVRLPALNLPIYSGETVTIREWESKDFMNDTPKLEAFLTFLKQKAKMLKRMEEKPTEANSSQNVKGQTSKPPAESSNRSNSHVQRSYHISNRTCASCDAPNHKIYTCTKFLRLSVPERTDLVKKSNLCVNCLNRGHQVDNCNFGHCKNCTVKHHSLLHVSESSTSNTNTQQSLFTFNLSSKQVLLSTVLLEVVDSKGNRHDCRALLDPGSQSNFISSHLCHKLALPRKPTNITISGAFKVESKIQAVCQIQIVSKNTPFTAPLVCLVAPEICDVVPEAPIDPTGNTVILLAVIWAFPFLDTRRRI
ncbi:uncharacterized protein LOC126893220 [Diabrotica virgifera virgifera]|uniref:Peptidase aspartic putative domain-containing protein n=1 Tax=Diabrotica virgifera virgifera TaxID=50390 RepID=A0ABM5L9N2_DIAVI|nr:uncharacterized protein LOC126893220 [Diabrotica virgifera virgifera]